VNTKYEDVKHSCFLRRCFLAQSRVLADKKHLRENDSSGIIDSCLATNCPHSCKDHQSQRPRTDFSISVFNPV